MVKRLMKQLGIVSAALLAASCATGYAPEYRYNQIRLLNNADQSLGRVEIQDLNSQRRIDCGEVGGFGFCQQRLPKPRYQDKPIEISWTPAGGDRETRAVTPVMNGPYSAGLPLQIEISFAEDGSPSAEFKQDSSAFR